MNKPPHINAIFKQAIDHIDQGDITHLGQLIEANPALLTERFDTPGEGYFANPYLLWFVANNPVRHETMSGNILEITQMLIRKAKAQQVAALEHQLDYTLALVVSGRMPKEAGIQLLMAEILLAEGAAPRGAIGALAHNNVDAARFLIEKGEPVELITAICLGLPDVKKRAMNASDNEKELALVGAAFYRMAAAVSMLISLGANVNAYPDPDRSMGFHSHATALHQAVFAGSLETVQRLVEAGAEPGLKDRRYGGTPQEWAEYGLTEEHSAEMKDRLTAIIGYLNREGHEITVPDNQ